MFAKLNMPERVSCVLVALSVRAGEKKDRNIINETANTSTL